MIYKMAGWIPVTMKSWLICTACILACLHTVFAIPTEYEVGVGIADITGPAAEVDMMGYANPSQISEGIHLRQFSRAFIVVDPDTQTRVVYVNIDACMLSQVVKLEVIKELKKKYGNLYTERNVCISGIHTHSGPGGFHQYILFDITSLGFVNETFMALKDGIVKSIERAHGNIQPANIYVNYGELEDSNINRSPSAYLNNPKEERARYSANTDKTMTVLKMVDANENPIGMLSWFAVHCTSMNNSNRLISSDNKGYASLLFEQMMNNGALPGKGPFVAAFGQSNEGDVSPNTKGPHCLDTGKPCDFNHSTCNGKNELCVAFGPGKDMFESTKIIGANQFKKALQLFNEATEPLSGPVEFRHTYTDMSQQVVHLLNNKTVKTCKPAMGYSFAAGTTDGPGAFDFKQGDIKGNKFWNKVRKFLQNSSAEQVNCHMPKKHILLDTGEMTRPYAWQPTVLDTQILRIGRLIIIAVPAEFTTMSGRRTREAVETTLKDEGFPDPPLSVIAGLANDYADYVTTYEEYQAQRYEGGSTVYGPHTLEAYIQVYKNLSKALAKGDSVAPGPNPPNLLSSQLHFLPPVVFDTALFKKFGEVVKHPNATYKPTESVKVTFVGANPRNDRKAESTFLEVLFQEKDKNWTVLYTDAHWETRFKWRRTSTLLGESEVDIQWDIPANQKPGMYMIKYYGNYKEPILGTIFPFVGQTKPFNVSPGASKQASLNKLEKWNKFLEAFEKAGKKKNNL